MKEQQTGRRIPPALEIPHGSRETPSKPRAFPKHFSAKGPLLLSEDPSLTSGNWTWTAIAAAEAFLSKQSYTTTDKGALSQMHMVYDMFDLKSEGEYKNPDGKKPGAVPGGKQDYAGNYLDGAAYLTRGGGCVEQRVDPMGTTGQALMARKYDFTAGKPGKFLITGLRYLENPYGADRPDPDFVKDVKECVTSYGGVGLSIYFDPQKEDNPFLRTDKTKTPWERSYYCYEDAESHKANFDVLIIGWDDDYSPQHFKKKPAGSGAFKARLSGAVTTTDDRILWISYEDMSFADPYCITSVWGAAGKDDEDFYAKVNRIARHSKFGMMRGYTHAASTAKITYECRFTAGEGETLTGVGLFTLTPCLAKVVCTENGREHVLVQEKKLSYAGYHTVMPKEPVTLSGKFSIKVTYTGMRYMQVFAPVEYRDEYTKDAITVSRGNCFIDGTDLADLCDARDSGKQYGNLALHAFLENTSTKAKAAVKARKELALPTSSAGYLNGLADCQQGLAVQWRLEPYHGNSYMPDYKPKAQAYSVKGPDGKAVSGIQNLSDKEAATIYVSAAIGGPPCLLRKTFTAELAAKTAYSFVAKVPVPEDNLAELSGTFTLHGARVQATLTDGDSHAQVQETTVDGKGKWNFDSLILYDPADGWRDAYETFVVKVQIKADAEEGGEAILAEGTSTISLTCPYKKDPADANVFLIKNLNGLACAAADAAQGQTVKLTEDFSVTGASIDGMKPLCVKACLDGDGHTISFDIGRKSLLDTAAEVRNLKMQLSAGASAGVSARGGIARLLEEDGKISNCAVSGTLREGCIGGLMAEGTQVTVKDCSVNLKMYACEDFGGIALTFVRSEAENITVSAVVSGKRCGGIAYNLNGGTVSKVKVDIKANCTNGAGGVAWMANNTNISQADVSGILSCMPPRGGKEKMDRLTDPAPILNAVGGIVGMSLAGVDLADCRVDAEIMGETAGGIAGAVYSGAGIRRCLSLCRVAALAQGPFRVACGIAANLPEATVILLRGSLSACSHISAESGIWRTCPKSNEISCAYEGITGNMEFQDTSTKLVTGREILTKAFYEGQRWDFENVWAFSADCGPVLKGTNPSYAFPFPNPKEPAGGFSYQANTEITISGLCHQRTSNVKWLLEKLPSGSKKTAGSVLRGEGTVSDGQFTITVGSLAESGHYRLDVIGVLENQEYTYGAKLSIT